MDHCRAVGGPLLSIHLYQHPKHHSLFHATRVYVDMTVSSQQQHDSVQMYVTS